MSYHYTPPPVVINERTNEGLTDANARIGKMSNLVAELEVKIEAMYRVMLDQGIDPALFEAKIEEIMKEKRHLSRLSLNQSLVRNVEWQSRIQQSCLYSESVCIAGQRFHSLLPS